MILSCNVINVVWLLWCININGVIFSLILMINKSLILMMMHAMIQQLPPETLILMMDDILAKH